MKNKVVFLFSPGPFGGAEKIVLKAAKAMEIPIFLIKERRNPKPCEKFQEKLQELQIENEVFISSSRFDYKLIKELNNKIIQLNINTIHSHGMKANFINSFLKANRVATQHGKTSHTLKTRILESIEEIRLKKVQKLICVSEEMFKTTRHPHKILIENFIPELLEYKMREKNPNERLKIVFIGRLSKEKGILPLIEIATNLTNFDFHIYGQGDLEHIVRKASQTSYNIHYHGFSLEISKNLYPFHLLIIPSFREGLPLVALEALASGLPVLASQVGGLPKLLKNNLFLAEPGNTNDFIQKTKFINNQFNDLQKEIKKISESISSNYSLKNWIAKTNEVYESF